MKLFIGLFCALMTTIAFAEEDVVVDEVAPAIVERMTCAQIQKKITELSAEEEPDDFVLEEIAKLKSDYRRSCTKSAGGRRSAAASRVVVHVESNQLSVPEEVVIEEDAVELVEEEVVEEKIKPKKKTQKKKKAVLEEESVDETTTEEEKDDEELVKEKLDQELANLNSGLCVDGTKPNKYGCCGDELFKDLGNMVFACCPKDGGDCFPPIQ